MCTKTCTRQLETFSTDTVLVFAYLTQFLKTFCCGKHESESKAAPY